MAKDFLELATSRYSVRRFKNTTVEAEKINKIIKAGMIAPTACNNQPVKILVLDTKEDLEILDKCSENHFGSTLAFIISYDKTKTYIRNYDGKSSGEIDASIVATHMMLEAHDLEVGSVWIMHFIPEAVICEFNFPLDFEPVCILMMGYEEDGYKCFSSHFKKKNEEEIVVHHSYNKEA